MKRSRESRPSGIYYGYRFRDFVAQPESRWVKLHRWWEGCTSDPVFWRVAVYGGLLALAVVASVFL